MSDTEEVEVEFGDEPGDTAVLLLEAAEELDLDPSVVKTGGRVFVVPQEVRDKAFGKPEKKSESKAKKSTAKKSEK